MSTIIEDPAIPLVGRNGNIQFYSGTPSPTSDDNMSAKTVKPKYHKPKPKPLRFENVGQRLAARKELFQKRKIICDFALGFAVFGIILMIVENEMCMNKIYGKDSIYSNIVKFFITMSTVTLLGFTVWYHSLDIKLFMIDNGMEDWKLAMGRTRVLKIILELLIYAIHPIPGTSSFPWTTQKIESLEPPTTVTVPVDVILSLPMFLRLHLLGRVMMLHSKLFTDASSQSLGALNRIHFNFKFIFKSLMSMNPAYTLCVIMVLGCAIASWMLRACEMYHDDVHSNFFNSTWLITITFLSVGYGDIVPNSYCGRGICVMTGMFGAGCTALIVAILSRKLELSRAEKYVHNFVIDVELDKRHKHAAANILKEGWFVYKNRKKGTAEGTIRTHQRKLLKAIYTIREVKQEQRRLLDNAVTLVEMMRAQNYINNALIGFNMRQEAVELKVNHIEEKLENIDVKMDKILNELASFKRV
ncbi:unnamed protein product [Owenia fusiformis]|uniref:Uncharacterized protein n=1 Tax=Owenia fusiformis TaxID=6347 RepID=A0A8J1TAQ9_OWEFU|nr:unnamed protein product [Owenia fusiformis]